MGHEMKLVRSFSRSRAQSFSFGLIVGCFIVSFAFVSISNTNKKVVPDDDVSKNNVARINNMNFSSTTDSENDTQHLQRILHAESIHKTGEVDSNTRKKENMKLNQQEAPVDSNQPDNGRKEEIKELSTKITCDFSDPRTNICEMVGNIRAIGKSATVIVFDESSRSESWKIRPYARKMDNTAMANTREVTLITSYGLGAEPKCTDESNVTGIVFSAGGYSGNYFHAFADIFVPLFLTSYEFNGEAQFLVVDSQNWWIKKYSHIFQWLSNYEIVDLDTEDVVFCFQHMIVGLRSHKDLSIDTSRSPSNYSMLDFTKFLRTAYSLDREAPIRISSTLLSLEDHQKKPRILIIARQQTRRFINLDEIIQIAENLGYEVVVANGDGFDVAPFASVVNSCDVLMGVHGSGLTNIVFLPTTAIVIQVVPWGELGWMAKNFFQEPAEKMNLRYLEYNTEEEESTLTEQYPREHAVFRDPLSIHKQGWGAVQEIFLEKQDVKLNPGKVGLVLSKALELLQE